MLALLLSACLSPSSASFSFGSAASQDPLPPCSPVVLCNGDACADVCEDGSVVVDPWLSAALDFQRNLTRARPFSFGPHLGTHNALISRANGMGLEEDLFSLLLAQTSANISASHVRVPNQRLGLTDLLNLGVRHVEFDIWDVPSPRTGGAFEIRICHSPVPDPLGFAAAEAALQRLGLPALQWDPFLSLCSNYTLEWAMLKAKAWLQAHPTEVLGCFLDNRVAPWNADLVTQTLRSVWGPALMTPSDLRALFNGTRGSAASFPSRDAMLAAGKRIYCESNSYLVTNFTPTSLPEVAFYPTTWEDAWFSGGQPGPQDVAPFPNCTIGGDSSFYGRTWPRLLDSGDLAYSPQEEAESGIVLKPNGVADLAACAVNTVGLGDVSPAAARAFVWSWLEGEPSSSSSSGCRGAAMTTVRGRWSAQPCEALMPALCRRGDARVPAGQSPGLWNVTAQAVGFEGAEAACAGLGQGWGAGLPRDGMENARAAQRALMGGLWQQHKGLWLAHRV